MEREGGGVLWVKLESGVEVVLSFDDVVRVVVADGGLRGGFGVEWLVDE